MAAAPPRVHTLQVLRNDIVVREWGSGNSSALVYWPGLNPFGALDLIEAGPIWSERYGFRVVGISAPGCGESSDLGEIDAYRPGRLAEVVLEALDTLALDRVGFIGFSWGGTIAARLAAVAPERLWALVLLDSGYNDRQTNPSFRPRTLAEIEAELREQQGRFRFPNWEAFLNTVSSQPHWRPELEDRYRAGMAEVAGEIVPRSNPESAAAAFHGIEAEPVAAIFPKLRASGVPILLVASGQILSSESWASEALERFRSALPATDVEIVESAGHEVLTDQPSTIGLIGNWLQENALRN